MKRGRKTGQMVNPRDERGWMIPRPGTIRRRVYDAMTEGHLGSAIYGPLGLTRHGYLAHRACIVGWERITRRRREAVA